MKHAYPRRAFLIALSAVMILGCASGTPIVNVENAPVTTGSGKQASMDGVQRAIIRAGSALNMRMAVIRPGLVQATYSPRGDFTAVMEVSFTTKAYDIRYKTSENLKYDPATNTIHKNYNSWVANLRRRIDNELAQL